MSLSRRIEVLEQQASAARAIDTTKPPWAAPLFDCEQDATQAYHAWGAVLDAFDAGRCFVLYPETAAARRLAVDFIQPGASQEVCTVLREWLDYINGLWDKGICALEDKPHTLADYRLWLIEQRAEMSFWSTLDRGEAAQLKAVLAAFDADPDSDPDSPPAMSLAIEARYHAWCNEMEIELEDQSNQSPAPAH